MSTNFEMVNVSDLIIGGSDVTQRAEGVKERRAQKIAAEWDLDKVGTITVSRRADGTLTVPDGAHRVTAARIVGVDRLPAIVHTGLNQAKESSLFVGLNDFKKPTAVSIFLARLTANDPEAIAIMNIVESHQWRVTAYAGDGNISAISATERIYRHAGSTLPAGEHPEVLDWVLDVTTAAWGHDVDAVNGMILLGLAQLTGRFGSSVDTKKLVSEMSQARPKQILGHARALRDAMGGTLNSHVAKVLVGMHNKKRRTNLLPEWVWTR